MSTIIAIAGAANIDGDATTQQLAFECGKLVVERGYTLATGGLGGVMEHASRGGRAASNHTPGDIIGVLPGSDPAPANRYVDTAIPTGMGEGRNLLLVSMARAVITIGGGAGTLSEIAFAWQLRRLIVALGEAGWSGKLGGTRLDDRREDTIFAAATASEALDHINANIESYPAGLHPGVVPRRMHPNAAAALIKRYSPEPPGNDLHQLGNGSEGFVFADRKTVYKLFDTHPVQLELHWQMQALAKRLDELGGIDCLPAIQDITLCDARYNLVRMERVEGANLLELESVPASAFLRFLREMRVAGWVCTDLNPKNLIVLPSGAIQLVDIGHSLFPASPMLFNSMVRRLFVIKQLHGGMKDGDKFKPYLSAVNRSEEFTDLAAEFGQPLAQLEASFSEFRSQADAATNSETLNPLLMAVFREMIKPSTVLDYGSGHGDHARMLTRMGAKVTAFEPNHELVDRYQGNYAGVEVVDRDRLAEMRSQGVQFEASLCSLVLCYELDPDPDRQDELARGIVGELAELTSEQLVVVICNPLYTAQPESQIQHRRLDPGFNYHAASSYTKHLKTTARDMKHHHRPLSFYEQLFRDHNLRIERFLQTPDTNQGQLRQNSDFMVLILSKPR